jgi:hypothetical protein
LKPNHYHSADFAAPIGAFVSTTLPVINLAPPHQKIKALLFCLRFSLNMLKAAIKQRTASASHLFYVGNEGAVKAEISTGFR